MSSTFKYTNYINNREVARPLQRDRATHNVSWNLVICCTAVRKSHLERHAVREWFWRSLKVIRIATIRWAIHQFLSVVCSDNDSTFRDITTFTVYVTVCDLQKSFSFKKQPKSQVA